MIAPSYSDNVTGHTATRIDGLKNGPMRLDPAGVSEFFSNEPSAPATCFKGVMRRWNFFDQPRYHASASPDVDSILHRTVERAIDGAQHPVVALSGGLDSLLLAAVLHDVLGTQPRVATLATHLDGYCELDATARAAESLGLDLITVHASAEDLVEAIPDAVRAAEVPMYNAHPVSKWVFTSRIEALGFDRLLTGDGADQVCAHDPGIDYLPVVGSIFAASGLDVRWPFTDPELVAVLASGAPDPNKRALRSVAVSYIGETVASAPKTPRLAPALDVSAHVDGDRIQALATELGLTLPRDSTDDRARMNWATLALLAESHL